MNARERAKLAKFDTARRQELLRELVERRKELGIRQVDVAKSMGIGQPAVSELERGETSPKLETLQRYARAVKAELSVDWIPTNVG